ncbi:MAG: exodeoxyribonuclease V subunit alpha [Spirochaetaceae bacterium]|nr:exodeoxyribonuclease V subunit alpha [Spirochaetaceae bacterium]
MTAGDPLQVLTEARVLADIDRLFARSMADLGAGPEVVLAAAAVSALHRAGHTCLPLSEAGRSLADIVERPASDQEEVPAHARAVRLPARDAWRAALEASPVVANGGGTGSQLPRGADPDRRPSPLVLDHDRLYLHRLFEAESGLATRMRARAADLTPCDLGDALARVFGAAAHPATVAAARAAVERRLCIVTGGPGTGKTTLAAGLIALLADLGTARPHRIGLVTPTGKAAARLQEAVATQLDQRGLRSRVPALAGFIPAAGTIHRLLTRPDLRLDALLVDECSMVDLPLMNRLIARLPATCRLILLGDTDQLSSVEPGSVFSDLCAAGRGSPLASCVVRLTESHRFAPDRGIGLLAAAVVHGDADAALATLDDPGEGQTERQPLSSAADFEQCAAACANEWHQHIGALRAAETASAFPARRVLCAHRRGPFGVGRFNRLVERALRARGVLDREEFYIGRPIIVTRNDRQTGLSNGDTGVVVAGEGEHRQVWFPDLGGGGGRFLVAPSRLPEHDSFFALTVHRAQGSEYDEVVFIPGDPKSRVCTRELFYTAVTRARRKVTVLTDANAVRTTVQRSTSRSSGLSERLAAATPGSPRAPDRP